MTVCVIIPALRPHGTLRVLEAVADECDAAIVVDNGDGVVADAVAARAPWARVLRPGMNLGFGAAIHRAALSASEDVLLLLNDDVAPRPGFVSSVAAPFADPDVHQVACHLVVAGERRTDSFGLAFDRTLRAENLRRDGTPISVLGPSGAAAAYRRTTYLEVGGFAPELFAYWEDADLALRMWAQGYRCTSVLDAIADHARGTALAGRSPQQRELDAFGRGFILGRYAAWLRPLDRALVPLVDWPSVVRGCAVTRSRSLLRARREGIRRGRATPIARPAAGSPARRSIWQTLGTQLKTFLAGGSEVSPSEDVIFVSMSPAPWRSRDRSG